MVIFHTDKLRTEDSHSIHFMKKNYAKIFINDKLVEITTNMVVASGSCFIAQRLFNINSTNGDFRNYIVSHFGIGSGGSSVVGDEVVLTGPDICDIDNYTPIQIDPGNNTFLTSPSGIENAIKPITLDGNIEIIENTKIECEDPNLKLSTVLCTCVINEQEPTYLDPGRAVKIDEAALYYVNPDTNDVRMFAHITFFPKYIEQESTLTIKWYVIC